ncbi:Protein TRANSPORT INHIBITOR RESPONSE [Dirofilaria immitis]
MADNDKTVIATKNRLKLIQLCDKDVNDMMQYLMKHFVPNEPTARSLCMSSSDGWEMTEETVRKCLKYPSYSYALKNENDEIIATRIANIIERPQLNETSKHDTPNEQRENQSKKMAISAIEISRLINKLESKIWHLIAPSTTKLLEFLIISTHEKYTGRGLMYELMTFDIMEQKRNGIQGGISEATAYNSQKLFAKLGYQVIYQINYDEWLDKDGKQIFNCDDGTNCAQLVYKSY